MSWSRIIRYIGDRTRPFVLRPWFNRRMKCRSLSSFDSGRLRRAPDGNFRAKSRERVDLNELVADARQLWMRGTADAARGTIDAESYGFERYSSTIKLLKSVRLYGPL
jgi:hypothetical protein